MDNFVRLNKASQLAEEGQYDRARRLVMQAIEHNRRDIEAWWALAHVAKSDTERNRAIHEVLRLDPNHMHALLMRDQIRAGSIASVDQPRKGGASFSDTDDDFMTKVAMTLVAYFVLYIIGLSLNIYFLYSANKFRNLHGYKPQNVGCLWAMLLAFSILPLGLCMFFVGIAMVAA